MAARRCVLHGSFPSDTQFTICPVCGESTDYVSNIDADDNWEGNAARMREWLAHGQTLIDDIPILKDGGHIRVRFDGEHYWLHSWDVVAGGLRHRLRDSDLVQVGKQTFEILHYRDSQREYLVRPFSLTLSNEDLSELSGP